jgi:hypothetical protein
MSPMPLSIKLLLLAFVLFVLTMQPLWLFAALICLAVVSINGFRDLWR